ncbi:hydantoinase/oxoprolinase family protein [Martelella radicis]|uniref:N-methylhydantoinase A n=1 Tax=Martelella radicis TaxID=1397476 RepID=A0A7W6PA00_9HYPH|nr:hydantoinase/oxoprolinase family protein [Martelella radicis]MBB4120912.1 N-methylhydantoinase A [Martelella radicis]
MFRLAIDIGGTFSDVVLEGEGLSSLKVLTTPEAPEKAALEGSLALLSENKVEFSEVSAVIHGTTLATNALIERRGAKTALVTTRGFRDILEMGYERRFEQYDVNLELPTPLVPRELRLTIDERMDAYGQALRIPDEAEIGAIADRLRAEGVEAVAIGFLHATANDAHERQVASWLRARLPDNVTICLSSEVSPEIREYERFSTVAANAYVRPLMSRYLSRFDAAMRARGFAGEFLLMLSGGGLTTVEQAARMPIRLVESGPAGGVALGARVSREIGIARMLAFDMGGTTAKICFLENAQPATARRFEVARAWRDIKGSGLPVRIPTTELVEIGAGGGSIARRDTLGRLAVGPKSAGAAPGPAAYGLGGSEPTITDANVVLGKLSPEGFAGGRLALRPDLAVAAIDDKVVGPLGMSSCEWAAAGITEIGEEAMANAARVHAVEQGKNVSAYTLMASGGAGPLHAVRLAEKLGIARVVIPAFAGVGSAVGFLSAPIAYEVARSVLAPLGKIDLARLGLLQAEMADEANAVVRPALPAGVKPDIAIAAELRYEGQGHALRISLAGPVETADALEQMRLAFVETYRSVYGAEHTGNAIELVALSLVAKGPDPVVATVTDGSFVPRPAAPVGTADVFSPASGERVTFQRYRRDEATPGAVFEGPMLMVEDQTTIYAPAGWRGYIHALGHVVLEREGAAS